MSVFPLIKAPQLAVFTVSVLFAVINVPFVVLRFAARRRSWGKFTLSDAALLAAFVSGQSSRTIRQCAYPRVARALILILSLGMHDGSLRYGYNGYVLQLK